MLNEQEIRTLFGQEAGERLRHLDELLLRLEHDDADQELIASMFREIHTLKGSAAVAGLDEFAAQAHQLEELVDELRSGRGSVTSDVIDTLLAGADQMRTLIAPARAEPTQHPPLAHQIPVPAPIVPTPIVPTSTSTAAAAPRSPSPAPDTGGVVMVSTERLDELVRLVGESATAHLRLGRMLKERFGVDPGSCTEYNELSRTVNELQDRTMRTRMVPVSTITDQLHRGVRDLARQQGKDVRWEVRGGDTELDRGVLNQLSESLLHLVRNAVDHGIEAPAERAAAGKPRLGQVALHAMQLGSEVIIAVTDDGRGIDVDQVRQQAQRRGIDVDAMSEEDLLELAFLSGLSTTAFVTDVSGRGVGLDVVRTNVEGARGRVEVRSQPGAGTEFRMIVPITLAVLRCLLVEAGGQRFALPFHRIVRSQQYDPAAPSHAEGREVTLVEGRPVPSSGLADVLGLPADQPRASDSLVVLADTTHRHAFRVERLVGQRDVVLKGLSRLLPHLPAVAGASIEPDGSILIVLDPPGLIQRARQGHRGTAARTPLPEMPAGQRHRIMVVDDALTVRELQRNILERAGFEVRLATDGGQALAALADEPVDLVLTDVEMPNMDGFALTAAIRSHASLANTPVLILSSRASDADRQRGLDAGADGYIVKSGFDEGKLLSAVNRLIGART